MRWNHLSLTEDATVPEQPLIERGAVARTFDTPEFRGLTFYEIHAKSIINRVPAESRVPFGWTINPYRGCSHACTYCFARKTHRYLDLDSGADFDSKIVVKVNAAELVRRELAAPRWRGEPIAMGTNVDCYQRAEGRYRLMPGIIAALRDAANPFSILTKGALILRDLPLLAEAAERTEVGAAVSVGAVDRDLTRLIEPGAPLPRRRLEVCAALNEAGIGCAVLMGPVIPYLSDSPAQLEAAVRDIAAAGATSVTAIPLHLRPGAREWFMAWLREHHPSLVVPYARLYRGGSYTPREYQEKISAQIRDLARAHGIGPRRPHRPAPPTPPPGPEQLTLL
ncbi:Rv2578c family radical SAM protein [Spirillospora sp. CA-294931]|uniref:Rv2578c family radical SAM protein n=1 Tax=Spirillospora sp. CA-294931 TaxID=3240042 RepID=UPI003D8CB981